jgi:hypothetical protein
LESRRKKEAFRSCLASRRRNEPPTLFFNERHSLLFQWQILPWPHPAWFLSRAELIKYMTYMQEAETYSLMWVIVKYTQIHGQ